MQWLQQHGTVLPRDTHQRKIPADLAGSAISPASLLHLLSPALRLPCASPSPLHPDWGANSVRVAVKRLSVSGAPKDGCCPPLHPNHLPTTWAVLNREVSLGTTGAGAFPGDQDESHTQGKWKNPTSTPCWWLTEGYSWPPSPCAKEECCKHCARACPASWYCFPINQHPELQATA